MGYWTPSDYDVNNAMHDLLEGVDEVQFMDDGVIKDYGDHVSIYVDADNEDGHVSFDATYDDDGHIQLDLHDRYK